jgi:hypothetical protein
MAAAKHGYLTLPLAVLALTGGTHKLTHTKVKTRTLKVRVFTLVGLLQNNLHPVIEELQRWKGIIGIKFYTAQRENAAISGSLLA